MPGTLWAVNVSGDGRLVVTAYSDGTIRWHRMDDGQELLAFFPMADRKRWVALGRRPSIRRRMAANSGHRPMAACVKGFGCRSAET